MKMQHLTEQEKVDKMADTLTSLLSRHPRYRDVLKEIVIHERDGGGQWRQEEFDLSDEDIETLENADVVEGDDRFLLSQRWDIIDDALQEADIITTEDIRDMLAPLDLQKYQDVIEDIIEYERTATGYDKKFGWEMSDIQGLNGGMISQLLSVGLIDKGHHTNKYRCYKLTANTEMVEEALRTEMAMPSGSGGGKGVPFESEFLEDVTVTDEDKQEFQEILKEHNGLDYWRDYVCPKVVEMEDQKEAILIALASHWNEHDDRFRVNILMYGKDSSGTGKTPLLKWAKKMGGGYAAGTRSTRSGLTVNMRDGSAGFLPRYHKSVVGLDEVDKCQKYERDGILTSCESGVIPYEAGDVQGEWPAEAIIIASANDISCFTPEQLGRFDLRFHIDKYNVQEAQTIAEYRSMTMGKPKEKDTNKFKKFLKWVRGRKAKISDEMRRKGAALINKYIEHSGNTDIRRIEAIWRIARSIARLNYRDVREEDIERGIAIIAKCYRNEKD